MKKFLFSFMLIAGLLTLSGCGQKEDENALVILNYGKYIEPDVIQQFEKETGITIKYEEYESPEEMYTKYKAGSIKYDLICTSDYMIQKLINTVDVPSAVKRTKSSIREIPVTISAFRSGMLVAPSII